MSEPHVTKQGRSRDRTGNASQESRGPATPDEHDDSFDLGPTDAEMEDWAVRVRRKREAWVAGPTDEEKRRWARRESRRRQLDEDGEYLGEGIGLEADPIALRAKRSILLARQGLLYTLMNRPFFLWSRWIRAGRAWETNAYQGVGRSAIPLDDELLDEG